MISKKSRGNKMNVIIKCGQSNCKYNNESPIDPFGSLGFCIKTFLQFGALERNILVCEYWEEKT
jgi:hypothetical protein